MRIVVVEDNALVAKGLELTLTGLGHEVCAVARSADQALAAIERCRPDIITCDVDLGTGASGVDVARAAMERWRIRTLFITAVVDERLLDATRACTPLGHLAKGHVGGGLRVEPFDESLECLLSSA